MALDPLHPVDAYKLDDFLSSPSGVNILARLRSSRPPLGDGESIDKCALMAQEAKGWENCLNTLIALAELKPKQREESPFLDTSKD